MQVLVSETDAKIVWPAVTTKKLAFLDVIKCKSGGSYTNI